MANGGTPTFTAYDRSEIDAELSHWDTIKANWDDAELNRVEDKCFYPMRDMCQRLGDLTEETRMKVANMSDELDAI